MTRRAHAPKVPRRLALAVAAITLLSLPTVAAAGTKDAHIISLGAHGTTRAVHFRGRVHHGKAGSNTPGKSKIQKLGSTLKAFARDDFEGAQVAVTDVATGKVQLFKANDEGFFDAAVTGSFPAGTRRFVVGLSEAGHVAPTHTFDVGLVDDKTTGFVVVCDIDDTIADTGVTGGKAQLVARIATSDASDMKAFPYAANTLRAFANSGVPVIYLSASPVEIAPRLTDFLAARGFPPGALFLRKYEDDGMGNPTIYKRRHIDRLLADFPNRKLVLIGDNGEHDVNLFAAVGKDTQRVARSYIRSTLAIDGKDPRYSQSRVFQSWRDVAQDAGKQRIIRWLSAQAAVISP
jgi:phosphatidate phosphatase APP1